MARVRADSRGLALAGIAGLVLGLAACSTGAGSSAAPTTASASASFEMPGATDEDTIPPSLDPSLPGQSDVDGWGPIWNALPPSYPVFARAKRADAGAGPVSAAYTVANVDAPARDIAQFYLDALDGAGLGTGLDGPLEDGSFTVWSSTGYGCDSLVTVLPRRTESLITVLYGAGCPFE